MTEPTTISTRMAFFIPADAHTTGGNREPVSYWRKVDGDWHHAGCERDDRQHHCPPADLVALTKRCTTCKGSGVDLSLESIMRTFNERMNGAPAGTVGVDDCPDCHNGARLVEARQAFDHEDYGSGTVSLGMGTLELFPVVDISETPIVPGCQVDAETTWFLPDVDGATDLIQTLPYIQQIPIRAEPDDWVACWTEVAHYHV